MPEKHADFLRDFQEDTVHPATARLRDEFGPGGEFHAQPLWATGPSSPPAGSIVPGEDPLSLTGTRQPA